MAALCASAAIAGAASAFAPEKPDATAWITDGSVHAIARSEGRTYIGGEFEHVGPSTGHGVALAKAGTGALEPPLGEFPEIAGGRVYAALSDGADGWYIGGGFTHVAGRARKGLAHLIRSDGGNLELDEAWAPAVGGGSVHAIARGPSSADAAILYVGGTFQTVAGETRPYAAAVDRLSGEVEPTWNPRPDGAVHAIAAVPLNIEVQTTPTSMSVVFVGGDFLQLDTAPATRLSAVWGVGGKNAASGTSTSGQTVGWSAAPEGSVRALVRSAAATPAAPNDKKRVIAVYAGGDYPEGLTAFKFSISTATAAVDGAAAYSAWRPRVTCTGCPGSVRALAFSDDQQTLYFGGKFHKVGQADPQADRLNLAAVPAIADVTGSGAPVANATSWAPAAAGGQVRALAVSGGTVYVGGDFTSLGGSERRGLAAVDTATGEPTAWDPRATGGLRSGSTGVVNALGVDSSRVYAGGTFTSIGATPMRNLAAFNPDGGLDAAWRPNPDGAVHALAAANARLYVGGEFTELAGAPRARLGALALPAGGLDAAWNPSVSGPASPTPTVLAMSATDQAVYVGGSFSALGTASIRNAGALHPATGEPLGWRPQPNGNVYALLASCGTVYAGGAFTEAGGAPRARMAALDPTTGAATSWNPVANAPVHALAQDAGVLYVGGRFSHIDGSVRQKLAAFSVADGRIAEWDPVVGGDAVRALAAPPDEPVVYAGGTFDVVRSAPRRNIAAIDRVTGAPTAWQAGTDDLDPTTADTVRALVAAGSALYMGGDFRQVGSPPQARSGLVTFGNTLAGGMQTIRCGPPEPPPAPPAEPTSPPHVERTTAPPVADTTPPVLTNFSVRPRRLRLRKTRTTFRYALSEVATVRVSFRLAKPCRKKRRRARCRRSESVARVAYAGRAGTNRRRFTGRIAKRRFLRPGRYRVRAVAVDAAGNRSTRAVARLRVLRR